MKGRYRDSPRLKEFDYAGSYTYHLTFVTRQRAPFFKDAELVVLAEDALHRAAAKHQFELLAYSFMPDHLHVLVCGSESSALKDFARFFKQLSGFAGKRKVGKPIWQISYYDHILRREEDIEGIARYIWSNPVRAHLAERPSAYPYNGPRPVADD